jgi:hypothetical protein
MLRREFMTIVLSVVLLPTAARAQQPAKTKRLAIVNPAIKTDDMRIGGDPGFTIFFEEVKRLGYVEGVNLTVERYSAEGPVFQTLPAKSSRHDPTSLVLRRTSLLSRLSPKLAQFQSSPGQAIRSSTGSYQAVLRDPVVTSLV